MLIRFLRQVLTANPSDNQRKNVRMLFSSSLTCDNDNIQPGNARRTSLAVELQATMASYRISSLLESQKNRGHDVRMQVVTFVNFSTISIRPRMRMEKQSSTEIARRARTLHARFICGSDGGDKCRSFTEKRAPSLLLSNTTQRCAVTLSPIM